MFLAAILSFIGLGLAAVSTIYALLVFFNPTMHLNGILFFVLKYLVKNFGVAISILLAIHQLPENLYWLIVFFPMTADLLVNIPVLTSLYLKDRLAIRRYEEIKQRYGEIARS